MSVASPQPAAESGAGSVPAAAEQAREAVDALLRHRVLQRSSAAASAESALRGARASAALEGAEVSLERLRGWTGPREGEQDRVVQGALRVYAELGPLAPVWARSPLQALARLHVVAAADLAAPDQLGRPVRSGPRLAAIAELATSPAAMPAVVEAALVHGELLAIEPFSVGNGVLARAAGRLVLIARGLDPASLAVPEVGHWQRRREYRLAARDYTSGAARAAEAWVVHCCRALRAGAQEGLAICEALLRSP